MIQYQVKLKLTQRQERQLDHWQRHLASVWNWAIRKIEQDAHGGIYYSSLTFRDILNGHGRKIGVPQDALVGTLWTAHNAWQRCFKNLARKPRLKGRRNKLSSIAFAHGTAIRDSKLVIPILGHIRYHKQSLPSARISQFRLVKRSSNWYACLFMKAERKPVPVMASGSIGIDAGFRSLLTISTGEKIDHPREFEAVAQRLAQAQRGHNRKLVSHIYGRIANRRQDRNHKISTRLVSENTLIAFSADDHSAIGKRFGKSVQSSGHYQLRQMLSYKSKCRTDGLGVYVEVDSRNSTKTCSACGCLSGPTGLAGLKVRQWTCAHCGTEHDRDVNAAINTLIAGAGLAHERLVRVA